MKAYAAAAILTLLLAIGTVVVLPLSEGSDTSAVAREAGRKALPRINFQGDSALSPAPKDCTRGAGGSGSRSSALPLLRMKVVTFEVVAGSLQRNWIAPGNCVDVVLTERTGGETRDRVILRERSLLAVNWSGPAHAPGYSVSLAVTPSDMQQLGRAETLGELSVVPHEGEEY